MLLGNLLQIPVAGSLLYIQPLYVESSRNPFPELQRVDRRVRQPVGHHRQHAVDRADHPVRRAGPDQPERSGAARRPPLSPQAQALLAQAQAVLPQAQTDLKAGNLGAYQNDINALESALQAVQALTGGPVASTTTTTTTNPGSAAAAALSN